MRKLALILCFLGVVFGSQAATDHELVSKLADTDDVFVNVWNRERNRWEQKAISIGNLYGGALQNSKKIVIALEGDSRTAKPSPTTNFWWQYMPAIAPIFKQAATITNFALGGDTVTNMVLEYPTQAHTVRPETNQVGYFFCMAGINGMLTPTDATNIFVQLTNLCAMARADGFIVVLFTDPGASWAGDDRINAVLAYNALMRANPQAYDILVDAAFALNSPSTGPADTNLFSDQVHFTDAGSQIVANEAARALTKADLKSLLVTKTLPLPKGTQISHARNALMIFGSDNAIPFQSGEVIGGMGFWGLGAQHAQFDYRAGNGFEFLNANATGPGLNATNTAFADVRGGNITGTSLKATDPSIISFSSSRSLSTPFSAGDIIGGLGFWGYGYNHGQFDYRAGNGFECLNVNATGPGMTAANTTFAPLRAGDTTVDTLTVSNQSVIVFNNRKTFADNEVIGGIGFYGYGYQHGQFNYRAGRGFEFLNANINGIGLNADNTAFGDVRGGLFKANSFKVATNSIITFGGDKSGTFVNGEIVGGLGFYATGYHHAQVHYRYGSGFEFVNANSGVGLNATNTVMDDVKAANFIGTGFVLPNGIKWVSGTGAPEGVVTAPIGSLYSRVDGSTGTTLYVKQSGTGNTGWVAK